MSRISNLSSSVNIECSDQPLDISFHPTIPHLVAAALVDGTVEVHDYSSYMSSPQVASIQNNDDDEHDDTIISSTQVHTQRMVSKTSPNESQIASCRTVQFSNDGTTLWTGGAEGDIVAIDTTRICTFTSYQQQQQTSNHNDMYQYRIHNGGYHRHTPIQVIYEIPEHNIFATGDDIGCIRLWDPRLLNSNNSTTNDISNVIPSSSISKSSLIRGCIADWKIHDDYISAIQHNTYGHDDDHHNTLLASSADGTISIYDIRQSMKNTTSTTATMNGPVSSSSSQNLPPGVIRRSDPQDDELLSLCIIKNGKKVICGTTDGVLCIFSYGTWGDVSDRFPGHPSSIDAIVRVDDDTILTGSSDGYIRVISIQPNKLLGIIGDQHDGFPIERLQYTYNKQFVGSVTHDNYIRLWDTRILDEDYDDDEHDVDDHDDENNVDNEIDMYDEHDDDRKMPAKTNTKTDNINNSNNSDDEWEDMDEDDDDDDTNNDDDDSDDDDDDMNDNNNNQRRAGGNTKNNKRQDRLKSERERFFDDL